jgi:hypothetical protein
MASPQWPAPITTVVVWCTVGISHPAKPPVPLVVSSR